MVAPMIEGPRVSRRVAPHPEFSTRFFEVVEETTIEFVKGADGKVTHLMIDGRIQAPRVGEK